MAINLKRALKNIEQLQEACIVPPGKRISLSKDFDPASSGFDDRKKNALKNLLAEGVELLAEYQDRLYAQDNYALLIILQALDAAGKDGTIKHVMSGVNPQGCEIYSFKAPSAEELDHDYLWRCAIRLPARGHIGIFNRSYYEEVLVTRVHPEILEHQKIPKQWHDDKILKRRYQEINNFEKYLFQNGIIVLKFFLNVSKDEQKRRFLERIDRPEKNWKFSPSDANERTFWKHYQDAYEECFNNTSTEWAPWYVIPADKKWYRNLAVAQITLDTLKSLDMKFPKPTVDPKTLKLR